MHMNSQLLKEKLGLRNYERLLHIVRTRSIDGKVKILDEDFFWHPKYQV